MLKFLSIAVLVLLSGCSNTNVNGPTGLGVMAPDTAYSCHANPYQPMCSR